MGNVMSDKRIGELWQSLIRDDWAMWWLAEDIRNIAQDLIRKLVEERAHTYCHFDTDFAACPERKDHEEQAIRDFCISPEDWKCEKI